MTLRITCCHPDQKSRPTGKGALQTDVESPEAPRPLPNRGWGVRWLFFLIGQLDRRPPSFLTFFSGNKLSVLIRTHFSCVLNVFTFHLTIRSVFKRYKGLGWQLALTGSSGPSPGSWNRRRLALAFKIFDGNVVKLLHFKTTVS